MMFERKALYSPHEVARIAGLSTSTILNYIRSEKLYAIKLSERTYRIPIASLIATFFPELKRPPKIVRRTVTASELEAESRRELRRVHEEYDRLMTGRRAARPAKRAPRPRKAATRA